MNDYLTHGLVDGHKLKPELQASVDTVARAWHAAAVDPAPLELLAELLARWAAQAPAQVERATVLAGVDWLGLPPVVTSWLEAALGERRTALELAAVAVHLVDIVERLALAIFIPELPSLMARSERTGGAARSVGAARHLKG